MRAVIGMRSLAFRQFSSRTTARATDKDEQILRLSVWCESPNAVKAAVGLFENVLKLPTKGIESVGENEEFYRLKCNSNTWVDFVSPSSITWKRRFLMRKSGGARLVQVAIAKGDETSFPSQTDSLLETSKLLSESAVAFQDRPQFFPKVVFDDDDAAAASSQQRSSIGESEEIFMREVVIGVGENGNSQQDVLESLHNRFDSVGPYMFQITSSTVLRVLPSAFSAIVFSVPDLEFELVNAERDKTFSGRIGATGCQAGQFHVTSKDPSLLNGFDVRLCGIRGSPSPMFAESNESTYDEAADLSSANGDMSCRGVTALEGRYRIRKFFSNFGFSK